VATLWGVRSVLTEVGKSRAFRRARASRRCVAARALRHEQVFDPARPIESARFTLALPDDPDLLGRLTATLAAQSDPPITVGHSPTTIVVFEAETWDAILRSRVLEALESAIGPDWQSVVRPIE
jgi:hypothetical protein